MDEMNDFLKSLQELKNSLIDLQNNTDELLRNAPKEEIKKTFRDKTREELETSLEYFTKHQNYEVCQAIKEVIEEKQQAAGNNPQ